MSNNVVGKFSKNVQKVLQRSYRTLNLKTTDTYGLPFVAEELSKIDGARVAYCRHHEDGYLDHFHLVAQFPSPQHLAHILEPIAEADKCFYLRPCRLFRSSYRYLAHLDNPEKHRVDVTSIVHLGDWDGTDLAKWQAARVSTVSMQELTYLAREYVNDCKPKFIEPSSINFAIWLEDRLVNPRSALGGLRQMGIASCDLFDYASKLPRKEKETDETDN